MAVIDMKSQRIAAQLHHFYATNTESTNPFSPTYSHFTLNFVYDHLKESGTEFIYLPATKKGLNKLARHEAARQHPTWTKERLEKAAIDYYKTYLTRLYLIERLPEQIKVINADTNREIKLISFVAK